MSDQKKKHDKSNAQPTCPSMGRRKFLKGIGTGAVAGIMAPAVFPLTGCDPTPPTGGCDGGTTGVIQLSKPSAPTGTATVSIVKKNSVQEMVEAAIDLAGGLNEINQGDSVIIKPNITSANQSGGARIATSPEVIEAVIRVVSQRTAARNITVSDASAFGGNTQNYARQYGLYQAVTGAGANFEGWQSGSYTRVQARDAQYLNWAFRVPTVIARKEYDHFINCPILKNHEMVPGANVQYTCCIKAHVGVLHPTDRLSGGGRGIHLPNLGQIVAELSLAVPVHTMNVIDATYIIMQGGPSTPTRPNYWTQPGLILASKDRVAGDALAVAVLKYYAKQHGINRPYVNKSVWQQAAIKRAQQLNLGRSENNIQVVHDMDDSLFDDIYKQYS